MALDPTVERIQQLLAGPADSPVVMVNLLRFPQGAAGHFARVLHCPECNGSTDPVGSKLRHRTRATVCMSHRTKKRCASTHGKVGSRRTKSRESDRESIRQQQSEHRRRVSPAPGSGWDRPPTGCSGRRWRAAAEPERWAARSRASLRLKRGARPYRRGSATAIPLFISHLSASSLP